MGVVWGWWGKWGVDGGCAEEQGVGDRGVSGSAQGMGFSLEGVRPQLTQLSLPHPCLPPRTPPPPPGFPIVGPTLCKSSMRYLPLGFKSAMKGVLLLILWKSSRSKGQPASLDMASRWSTALVLPPSAMTVVIAFSKAFGVMMSRGLMSRFSSSSKALHHKQIRMVQ